MGPTVVYGENASSMSFFLAWTALCLFSILEWPKEWHLPTLAWVFLCLLLVPLLNNDGKMWTHATAYTMLLYGIWPYQGVGVTYCRIHDVMLRIIENSWKNQPKQVTSVKHINAEMSLAFISNHEDSKCSRFLVAKGLWNCEEVELML